MISLPGHFNFNETSFVTITADDIISTISCFQNCTTSNYWILDTYEDLRIRVTFKNFSFLDPEEYMEIGDGLIIGAHTRLTHFKGTELPSIVTTITDAAWITVHSKCKNTSSMFSILITAVSPGKHQYN